MDNPVIYGHRQLSLFFIPLLEIDEEGFLFKGKRYAWNDVDKISVWGPMISIPGCFNVGMPGARISLRDGKTIKINGRTLEKKGQPPIIGFFSCKSNAFYELTKLFKSKSVDAVYNYTTFKP